MAWVVGGAATLLLCVDGWGADKTTPLGLNWEILRPSGTETVKSRAPLPNGAWAYFTRDIGGGTSDDVFAIVSSGGSICSAMVPSSSPVSLRCGNISNLFHLFRTADSGGIRVFMVEMDIDPPLGADESSKPRVRL
jgi:hypothetical protein